MANDGGPHAFDALATVPARRLLKVMVQLSSCVVTGWRGLPKKETPVPAVLEQRANLRKPGQGLHKIAVKKDFRVAATAVKCYATGTTRCSVAEWSWTKSRSLVDRLRQACLLHQRLRAVHRFRTAPEWFLIGPIVVADPVLRAQRGVEGLVRVRTGLDDRAPPHVERRLPGWQCASGQATAPV